MKEKDLGPILSEAYWKPRQISKMDRFAKIVDDLSVPKNSNKVTKATINGNQVFDGLSWPFERIVYARRFHQAFSLVPVGIYLLKVTNRKTETRSELYSKITVKTEQCN